MVEGVKIFRFGHLKCVSNYASTSSKISLKLLISRNRQKFHAISERGKLILFQVSSRESLLLYRLLFARRLLFG